MAIIANPKKAFQFAIDIAGLLNPVSVQKITGLGESEVEEVEHGEGNSSVYTAGRTKLSPLTLEQVLNAVGVDNFFLNWHSQAKTGFAESYKKTMTIRHLAPDGLTTLKTYTIMGAWCKKLSISELDRMASTNLIKTIEIRYDKIIEF